MDRFSTMIRLCQKLKERERATRFHNLRLGHQIFHLSPAHLARVKCKLKTTHSGFPRLISRTYRTNQTCSLKHLRSRTFSGRPMRARKRQRTQRTCSLVFILHKFNHQQTFRESPLPTSSLTSRNHKRKLWSIPSLLASLAFSNHSRANRNPIYLVMLVRSRTSR